MVAAFQRISAILCEKTASFARSLDPDQWHPLTRFIDLMDSLTAGGRDVSPILFRADAKFIRVRFADEPDYNFINDDGDRLRYQTGSSVNNSVVRKPVDEVGRVELTGVD